MVGKRQINRLLREAQADTVLIHLRDGTVRAFDDMDVRSELFVTSMNLFKGSNHNSEVLDAVRAATSESRKAFEERFGPIRMESRIIAADYQGGWVETYTLTEDGSVQHAFHEGGSEEAERIRREAREGASRSWFG